MSDLSLKYDPQATSPNTYHGATDLMTSIQALGANHVPDSIRQNLSVAHHRDALIGTIITQMSDFGIKSVLNTLTTKIRSMADNTSDEVKVYCEMTAALAYATNDIDLAKKAMLRIEPTKADGLLKTIYSAMIDRNISPEAFKTMLEMGSTQAIQEWNRTVV